MAGNVTFPAKTRFDGNKLESIKQEPGPGAQVTPRVQAKNFCDFRGNLLGFGALHDITGATVEGCRRPVSAAGADDRSHNAWREAAWRFP